jgi:hypothetical protein
MADEPGHHDFRLGEEKRQLTTGRSGWCEQFTMRDVFAGSSSKIQVGLEKLVFTQRRASENTPASAMAKKHHTVVCAGQRATRTS